MGAGGTSTREGQGSTKGAPAMTSGLLWPPVLRTWRKREGRGRERERERDGKKREGRKRDRRGGREG